MGFGRWSSKKHHPPRSTEFARERAAFPLFCYSFLFRSLGTAPGLKVGNNLPHCWRSRLGLDSSESLFV